MKSDLNTYSKSVTISEGNLSKRSSSTGIVNYISYESSDVTISLSEIKRSVFSSTLSVFSVGLVINGENQKKVRYDHKQKGNTHCEDSSSSLPLTY